jgi:uncharacterized membrane protein YcjF (UPF0283 family)
LTLVVALYAVVATAVAVGALVDGVRTRRENARLSRLLEREVGQVDAMAAIHGAEVRAREHRLELLKSTPATVASLPRTARVIRDIINERSTATREHLERRIDEKLAAYTRAPTILSLVGSDDDDGNGPKGAA